jgi:hypothetical protein
MPRDREEENRIDVMRCEIGLDNAKDNKSTKLWGYDDVCVEQVYAWWVGLESVRPVPGSPHRSVGGLARLW